MNKIATALTSLALIAGPVAVTSPAQADHDSKCVSQTEFRAAEKKMSRPQVKLLFGTSHLYRESAGAGALNYYYAACNPDYTVVILFAAKHPNSRLLLWDKRSEC